MKRKWIFLAPLFLAAFIAIGGEVVLQLWNWLMPTVFGFRQITFWQAIGLLALSRILFGGFGMHGGRRRWRMTPEERARFRQGMRARCGLPEEPPAGPA